MKDIIIDKKYCMEVLLEQTKELKKNPVIHKYASKNKLIQILATMTILASEYEDTTNIQYMDEFLRLAMIYISDRSKNHVNQIKRILCSRESRKPANIMEILVEAQASLVREDINRFAILVEKLMRNYYVEEANFENIDQIKIEELINQQIEELRAFHSTIFEYIDTLNETNRELVQNDILNQLGYSTETDTNDSGRILN